MLAAYFDESANPTGEIFTLAGWVAVPSAWDHLSDEWRLMIKEAPHAISAFHMKHIAQRTGEYSDEHGWAKSERTALVTRATDIVLDAATNVRMFGVGCTFVPFGLRPTLSVRARYMICYQTVMWQVLQAFPIESGIDFIFDEKEKVRKHVQAHFYRAKAALPAGLRDRLGAVSFADDTKVPPLQAADLLAYERRKRTQDRLHGETRFRASYRRLLERPHSFKCWDDRLMENIVAADKANLKDGTSMPSIFEMLPPDED